GGGPTLDPLIGLDDAKKPLRSRLLAVPSLRARYLDNVRTLAQESLNWDNLGPAVAERRAMIRDVVETDTRKLASLEAFDRSTADAPADGAAGGPRPGLRSFADQRRKFLLSHPAIKPAPQDASR